MGHRPVERAVDLLLEQVGRRGDEVAHLEVVVHREVGDGVEASQEVRVVLGKVSHVWLGARVLFGQTL